MFDSFITTSFPLFSNLRHRCDHISYILYRPQRYDMPDRWNCCLLTFFLVFHKHSSFWLLFSRLFILQFHIDNTKKLYKHSLFDNFLIQLNCSLFIFFYSITTCMAKIEILFFLREIVLIRTKIRNNRWVKIYYCNAERTETMYSLICFHIQHFYTEKLGVITEYIDTIMDSDSIISCIIKNKQRKQIYYIILYHKNQMSSQLWLKSPFFILIIYFPVSEICVIAFHYLSPDCIFLKEVQFSFQEQSLENWLFFPTDAEMS